MKAILSDIHGNLEALQAVLEDISRHRVDAVYSLGDFVGYGPSPRECVNLAMRWQVALLGNFDYVVLSVPPDLGPTALFATRSTRWSQRQLDAPVPTREAAERRWTFLKGLANQHREGDFSFVHGSPLNPLNGYVFPEDVYNEPLLERVFGAVERYCFHGHIHVAGVITEEGRFLRPDEVRGGYRLCGQKVLCNVGSVGQPRDGDWRACYALFDGEVIYFRRVEYDIAATVKKIRAIDVLDDWLGERLRKGW